MALSTREAEDILIRMYRRAGNVQFQACSNPIPSKPTFIWDTDSEGNRIGSRKRPDGTIETVVSYRTKLAPLAKARPCGRGSISRTLGGGLGVIVMQPQPKPKRSDPEYPAFVKSRKTRAERYEQSISLVNKRPTWRQEIAGWSSGERAQLWFFQDRGSPTLYDMCRMGDREVAPKVHRIRMKDTGRVALGIW